LLADLAMVSVPLSEIDRYLPRIEATSAAQAQSAAKSFLDPVAASIVIVGDATQFADHLKSARADLEIIPAESLNLDIPALR
jgi:zinc protease